MSPVIKEWLSAVACCAIVAGVLVLFFITLTNKL
jgi:hypothetical protein